MIMNGRVGNGLQKNCKKTNGNCTFGLEKNFLMIEWWLIFFLRRYEISGVHFAVWIAINALCFFLSWKHNSAFFTDLNFRSVISIPPSATERTNCLALFHHHPVTRKACIKPQRQLGYQWKLYLDNYGKHAGVYRSFCGVGGVIFFVRVAWMLIFDGRVR